MAGKGKPPERRARPERMAHLLAAVTLAGLAAALYVRSLDGPFVFDDPNAIVQSKLVRSIFPLWRFAVFSTRPLTDFSFALDYALGQLKPRPYHATNILLHALNVLLVYVWAWQTLGLPALAARYGGRRGTIAWVAAAAFAAHPLATESVAYISSRSETLVALFMLLTLVLYAAAATTDRVATRRLAAAGIPVCAAAGLASKEIAATLPGVLVIYDWSFLAGGQWRRTRPRWWLVGAAALPLAAGGLFLAFRAYTSPSEFGTYGATAGISFERFGGGAYLMTQFGVIAHYLRLVVLPIGLNFDYDWPLATSPWEPGVLLPLALLVLLVTLAFRTVRSQPFFTFAVLATFVILAPTSSVLPIADIAVERRMYLPLVGWMLCASAVAWSMTGRRQPRRSLTDRTRLFGGLVAVPLVVLAVLTFERAALWGDAIALHQDGVAKAPANPRLRLNLGVTYLNLGKLAEAEVKLREAERLYERGESVHAFRRIGAFLHYNLGAVLFLRGKDGEASAELARSLQMGGEYQALRPMAFYLLGQIAARQGEWATAAERLQEAVRFQPERLEWAIELAEAQANSGQVPLARQTLGRVLRRDPKNQPAAQLLRQLQAERAAPQDG